jgi:hypothetical protein
VYLYLLGLLVAFILSSRFREGNSYAPTAQLHPTRLRQLFRKIVEVVYYIAIIINILMQTLEIVRLCLEYFGVGLLPFNYVGLIFGLALHATSGLKGRIRGLFWQGLNTFLWIGMMIVSLVKIAGLVKMEHNGIYRTDSKYPIVDWVTDVAIIAGIYLFLAVMEVWLGFWKQGSRVAFGDEDVPDLRSEK